MLNPSRLFSREDPSRDAKLFVIYCEGKNREPDYFKFFNRLSSQIRFEIVPAEQHGNNSPTGLFAQAEVDIIASNENPEPKYDIEPEDEVWFVIDTDTWGEKIRELRTSIAIHEKWFIAQSNPCFEVWLYFHFMEKIPEIEEIDTCKAWKSFLPDEVIPGGFDSRKHSIFISNAISNAKNCYIESGAEPAVGTTEVFKLADNFFSLVKEKIETIREIVE